MLKTKCFIQVSKASLIVPLEVRSLLSRVIRFGILEDDSEKASFYRDLSPTEKNVSTEQMPP
jgi:hypothetical protein